MSCSEARGELSRSYIGREGGQRKQFSIQVLNKEACKDNLITSASHLCSNDTVLDKKSAHNRVNDESVLQGMFLSYVVSQCIAATSSKTEAKFSGMWGCGCLPFPLQLLSTLRE